MLQELVTLACLLYCCIILTVLLFRKSISADDKIEIPILPRIHDKLKGRRIKPIRHNDKTLYEMSMRDEGRH